MEVGVVSSIGVGLGGRVGCTASGLGVGSLITSFGLPIRLPNAGCVVGGRGGAPAEKEGKVVAGNAVISVGELVR
jgi:hypothetical protein